MKKRLLSLGLVLFLTASLFAQDVIEADELFKAIRKKSVITIDARSNAKYKGDSHIRGAVHVAYADLQKNDNIKGMLKSTAEIAKTLGQNGVSINKPIVVYDEGSAKYAGRLYWILRYMGAQNVKILNGNLKAWKKARKPITKNPTMVKKSQFKAVINNKVLATMANIKKRNAKLVDVRSVAEFNGSAKNSKGHIPGAINIEFKKVLSSDGKLKSNAEITNLFKKVGGKNTPIILYCGTSVRAGIVFLALEGAGFTNVKVYDGAYNEWEAKGNKIEK